MTDPDKWRNAMWVLYDMTFHGLNRLEAYQRMRKLGLTKREAAIMILDHEKEREV